MDPVGPGGLALLTAVVLAALLVVAYTLRTGAPPWPSSPAARRTLLAALPPDEALPPGVVLELGSGWGGLALALAARLPGRRVVAVELSPVPWAVTRLRALAGQVGNLDARRADLHGVDVSDAALIICYLHRDAMTRLAARLATEAPAGARVVSNSFALGDWTPVARHPVRDAFGSEILVYRVAPAEGEPAGEIWTGR